MRARHLLLALALAGLTACTPARIVGNAAIDTGQVVLGAADALI